MITFLPPPEQNLDAEYDDCMETVNEYTKQSPFCSAWDLAGSVARRNNWTWASNRVTGKSHAALVLLVDRLSKM